MEAWTECIDIPEDWEWCEELYVAAHAVVRRTECELLAEAPYGASSVLDSLQGLRYDYTEVRAARSNPDAVLTFTTGRNEANFFSLGFQEDREEYPGVDNAWIVVEFDHPILNGPGADLRIVEDTWGLPYPDETAHVWVSQDGANWIDLGEADNQTPYLNIHTITDFDLQDVGLDYARFVKAQDSSQREDFAGLYASQGATLDGYDVNAILAMTDYEECTVWDETAWGEGERFNERGNWGMYVTYTLCEQCVPASIVYGVVGNGSSGGLYEIDLSGDDITEKLLKGLSGIGGDAYSPNGLAFDAVNNRLYYAVIRGSVSDLYFYDLSSGQIVEAGTGLVGRVYSATFGDGKYWYIANGSDEMYTVGFDGDGKVASVELFEANIAGGKSFNFGDIALDGASGIIYGGTSFSGAHKAFFQYDLTQDPGSRYSLVTSTGGAVGLQLAFGEDGVLYGHSTFGANGVDPRAWFVVNLDGSVSPLGAGQYEYNDLASGPSVCE